MIDLLASPQVFMSSFQSMDSFCPIGPAIVTPDELGDPHSLGIRCSVNGVTKQNSNTNQVLYKYHSGISQNPMLIGRGRKDKVEGSTDPVERISRSRSFCQILIFLNWI